MDIEYASSRARWVRQQVLEMVSGAQKGHIGGSFSCADLLVALYQGQLLRYDASNPEWELRDRFVMSKGHSIEALYAVLADAGFFDTSILATYGQAGSPLGGHADNHLPGIEVSTGSLGHGLGIAAGLALAAKLDSQEHLSVALLGDGECYEGAIWEAALFAAHQQLDNLVAIVDRNRQIILGFTEDVNRLEPFAEKWESFGWLALEFDGHDFAQISAVWDRARNNRSGKPTVLIANTIKGKGVSFMEGVLDWHHNVPKGDLLEEARQELALDG